MKIPANIPPPPMHLINTLEKAVTFLTYQCQGGDAVNDKENL